MNWRLLLGDCMARDGLINLRKASVDVVITDPPYKETALGWDIEVDGWLEQVDRVLRPGGTIWCFGSMRAWQRWFSDPVWARYHVIQDLVWEKHNGSGPSTDTFRRVHELLLHFRRIDDRWRDVYKDVQFQPGTRKNTVIRRKNAARHRKPIAPGVYRSKAGDPVRARSVVKVRSCHHSAIHPTQKPVELLRMLVRYSCPPGGTVLDPFAGSASTGEAAIVEGRRFVGWERDPNYYAGAVRRLRSFT